jgi:ABC transport system ATP-binding/permease protein
MTAPGALLVGVGLRRWRFEPGETVSIGRGADCDVVVDDPMLSRRHVRIEFRGDWVLQDAGTRNGTWVDGRRLSSHRLVGPVTLRLGDRRSGPTVVVDLAAAGSAGSGRSARTLTIGRARGNDVVLNDLMVSRHHARVETRPTGRQVVDLGSRNRTLVNGIPAVSVLPLADGDRLTVGNTEIEVDGDNLRPSTVALRRLVVDGGS